MIHATKRNGFAQKQTHTMVVVKKYQTAWYVPNAR